MDSIKQLIEKSGELGSLPAVIMRVNQALDDPDVSGAKVGRIVNEDPALTASLLKLVNSPFYGLTSTIDTVYRAIALIGFQELRQLVMTSHALKTFNNMPNDLVSMPIFWQRSLSIGVLTRILASYARERGVEKFFIIGLLHDLGSLIIYQQLPEQASEIIAESKLHGHWIREKEEQRLGFDHAQVGGALLQGWGLPTLQVEAVRYHLQPEKAPEESQKAAMLVNLAFEIYHYHIKRDPVLDDDAEIDPVLFERLDISLDALEKILEQAKLHFEEGRALLIN
ncbi:MAG: HDOD domain-containing protein [Gammaproteobacteria bacterium]|nr:HDOD domain-containing protein [Gammaproteobacteria bacterium]